jgi:NADPH:quinone reductase-like Zn-dependent oxidoreductase
MRAFVYDRYGGPEELRLAELPRPLPGPGQVRVRVLMTSLNSADVRLLRADPFLARLDNGLLRPKKRRVLGADVCGVVEEVGPGVTRFRRGDEVFGETMAMGAFAEELCLPEGELAARPPGVSVERCAAAPLAGVTALQAVRERARVKPGDSVLVMGAGGGVGTMLVQIAKAYGARVTALCGPRSLELVRSLGADVVLDRTQADPAGEHDAVFGVNGHRPLGTYLRWLKPGGAYVMIGGTSRQLFGALLLGKLRFLGSGRRVEVLTLDERLRAKDLAELGALLASGRLRPVIDRILPLDELPAAIRLAEAGHLAGKVVLDARGFGAAGAMAVGS